jgi:hypothetical protein
MRDKTIKSSLLGDKEFIDMVQDLRSRGCPVCSHLIQKMLDYYAHWMNAFSKDQEVQQEHANEGGFCPFHTWQLARLASPLGISQGYPQLLKRMARELLKLAQALTNLPDRVSALIKDSESCRVCSHWRDTEAVYIQRLSRFLQGTPGRRAYTDSQGVCLRHLGLLIESASSSLLSEAARHFDQIGLDMQNYTIKRNALRRDLITRDERDAYLRALNHIAGDKNGYPFFSIELKNVE